MAMAKPLLTPRGGWETMAPFPSSLSTWYEGDHAHTHTVLKRKEAEIMAYFTFSLLERDGEWP